MAALSQLSYGPKLRTQFSGEIEIVGPVDPQSLVVSRLRQAKLDVTSANEVFVWQEEAAVELRAVGGEGVDLAIAIDPPQEAIAIASLSEQTTP